MKTSEFINKEKKIYGDIYIDITNAINDVSPFLDKKVLGLRKYVTNLPILKKYFDLLDAAELEGESKSGFFSKFKNNDKCIGLLEDFKKDNKTCFSQLNYCHKCACLNCVVECKFDSCLGCKSNSHIKNCDHKIINVTFHDDYFIDLVNNNTGHQDRYLVLATMQYIELDKRYIILQNIRTDEKFVLYYYPGITEDEYGEISNGNEMDFAVSTFMSVDK